MPNIVPVPSPKSYTIKKNEDTEIRVSIREYRGHKFINCHEWYRKREGSDWLPGKGDLSLAVSGGRARELVSAMNQALVDAGF
jgi:hypothetical protein